ncbi:7-cyano-7-deazaguanine synthase in queuosine biosynthesis [Brevundimonas bullata]|uniref:7-cyano-7-deazaguanine synthase in queuosine biosynthesis n=1 Tax=Brevundimonas bullata TaxID=13160 RepID=A0A7W7IQN6_9CAUL|nr:7-cyano-7-deazaguanine synthase [Brevundimonas bullata]MBB4798719.1 7-cyano-7-deazaguanine synthase in queuosine biosynthesis [Brevundimonas bullata]MBB6383679.1 7-cyano-7-deazaguanine synthase in queuosine biosynthesis [Brevundimonas bullata]
MTGTTSYRASETALLVDAIEVGVPFRAGATPAVLGESLRLDTRGLTSFFFARFDRRLFDLLVVAAAVEFCDRIQRRPGWGWSRSFDVRVSVHDPKLWAAPEITALLEETLSFLTGDVWRFRFEARREAEPDPVSAQLPLPPYRALIMPYSEGLDSLAVHALTAHATNSELVRVRLGSGGVDRQALDKDRKPFARVPYKISVPNSPESSARSRGFKFAVVTAIAAAMSDVQRIIVTESGQGALGPVLVRSGHAYPDYRVHPAFSRKMERLFLALTGHEIRYDYPRLWHTKGETLAAAKALSTPPDFVTRTRSCWQSSQQASVEGARRQCGICAACMLRRLSMFTAEIDEPADRYVWENLTVADFDAGAASAFQGHTHALREYGIAGVLHMDHLASLASPSAQTLAFRRVVRLTADALGDDEGAVRVQTQELLTRHAEEWRRFVAAQGDQSFVARYAASVAA